MQPRRSGRKHNRDGEPHRPERNGADALDVVNGRIEFTAEDDHEICQYLAKTGAQGRKGLKIYNELLSKANENPAEYDWAKRHTAESWRERYKKMEKMFEHQINDISRSMDGMSSHSLPAEIGSGPSRGGEDNSVGESKDAEKVRRTKRGVYPGEGVQYRVIQMDPHATLQLTEDIDDNDDTSETSLPRKRTKISRPHQAIQTFVQSPQGSKQVSSLQNEIGECEDIVLYNQIQDDAFELTASPDFSTGDSQFDTFTSIRGDDLASFPMLASNDGMQAMSLGLELPAGPELSSAKATTSCISANVQNTFPTTLPELAVPERISSHNKRLPDHILFSPPRKPFPVAGLLPKTNISQEDPNSRLKSKVSQITAPTTLASCLPPESQMRRERPPDSLIEALEALTLGPIRMQATGQLPFLLRNLRKGFIQRLYEHGDDTTYQAEVSEWLCPFCELFGRFNTWEMLNFHLKCDHFKVAYAWTRFERAYTWKLNILIPEAHGDYDPDNLAPGSEEDEAAE
ncbi:hypothetical protein BDZ97DRAFT_1761981 [Flammula alnicola]|nr:hypothetical protein BDZ97DRAFT_1761981 [Flammula alnicola]